jgi:ketosteroid isomerase-like protein
MLLTLCAVAVVAQQSAEEQAVWKLEHTYWEYVKAQDLASYRQLWHDDFVGWPNSSAEPVRKDHISDWITNYAAKGLHLKSNTLKPAASQKSGQLVVVHYWVTMVWAGANGSEQPETIRVMHTWLKGEKGWQIISGMSMRELTTNH